MTNPFSPASMRSASAQIDSIAAQVQGVVHGLAAHLPKSEPEFRQRVAERPMSTALLAAAAGAVATQLALRLISRRTGNATAVEPDAGDWQQLVEDVPTTALPVSARARETVRDLADGLEEIRDRVLHVSARLRERAGSATGQVDDVISDVADGLRASTATRPIVTVAAAACLGFLVTLVCARR